ncbi:MAG: hypothetical protein A2W00_04495 [Candidatus Eisenbacteria bacterium RBG_16_71_46]|nr:MAG: hypothetical protein A2V59_06770 [Armatimonadetes bacterium RBG_19FT_COMBO_69_19]OGF05211.1 MAG: hypothetical protein A2W00_04495 [Candidatus Eisenbacteria bacterium RBG_16_71_46]
MDLKTLKAVTKALAVEYEGETLHLHYRPGAFTPELEDSIASAGESEIKTMPFRVMLVTLIDSWDLYDKPASEGGKVLPIDVDTLSLVPSSLLIALSRAIAEDSQPDPPSETGSFGS